MDNGAAGHDDQSDQSAVRPYPAQSRPEQPMHVPKSPWPWIIGLIVLSVVVFGGLLLWVMYEIGSNAG